MEARFQLLLTLLTILKSIRHKAKKTELEFLMVNQTFNMVPYRHCVYWEFESGKPVVKAASGLVQIDPDGPYTQWLVRVVDEFSAKQTHKKTGDAARDNYISLLPLTESDCPEQDRGDWKKWISPHALLVTMNDVHGKAFGGLWLDREVPFGTLETALLEDLFDGYAHQLQRFQNDPSEKKASRWRSIFKLSGSRLRLVLLVALIILCLPVRMSVNAPAEIVASKPYMINMPFDGVIDEIKVVPGQNVKEGDVLLTLDSTVLRNRLAMAEGELRAADTALTKTERESLADRTKLAEIAILRAQQEQKASEMQFARELLERAEIKADRDGIVIFSDPSALRGKPVQTGEQIMLLADPEDSELLIRIPVSSMIVIDEDVPAKFFLNVTPLGFNKATYESIGYQATPDADGLLTYKVRARFTDPSDKPRIGWTGTGKVYGSRTILAFNILRRPLVAMRSKLGI